jgi:rhodanese-related sulfurtransferase
MAGPVPSQIDVETLHQLRQTGEPLTILDVREPWEIDLCAIDGSLTIPLGSLPKRASELPEEGRIVVVCHHGMRSAQATAWLRHNGFPGATNLHGGIDAWARRIDPTMKVY